MVINFEEGKRALDEKKELNNKRQDVESKITYCVNKLLKHQEHQLRLKNKKLCLFRNYRLGLIEDSISTDKSYIVKYTQLHAKFL